MQHNHALTHRGHMSLGKAHASAYDHARDLTAAATNHRSLRARDGHTPVQRRLRIQKERLPSGSVLPQPSHTCTWAAPSHAYSGHTTAKRYKKRPGISSTRKRRCGSPRGAQPGRCGRRSSVLRWSPTQRRCNSARLRATSCRGQTLWTSSSNICCGWETWRRTPATTGWNRSSARCTVWPPRYTSGSGGGDRLAPPVPRAKTGTSWPPAAWSTARCSARPVCSPPLPEPARGVLRAPLQRSLPAPDHWARLHDHVGSGHCGCGLRPRVEPLVRDHALPRGSNGRICCHPAGGLESTHSVAAHHNQGGWPRAPMARQSRNVAAYGPEAPCRVGV